MMQNLQGKKFMKKWKKAASYFSGEFVTQALLQNLESNQERLKGEKEKYIFPIFWPS